MDHQRKKNHRAVQLGHLLNEYFADSVDHPVRVSADRVPTLSLVPTDPQMESSKVVLNKHGWNPVLKSNTEPMQKASYTGEVPRPRSILREPNENHRAEHLDSRLAGQLPESYSVSSSVSSNDCVTWKKGFPSDRNHFSSVTNGHNIRTSQINNHTNDAVHASVPRYDNSQYVGRRMDTAHDVVDHSHNPSHVLSSGVFGNGSSHGGVSKYDDSRGNFLRREDQPIVSACTLGSSAKSSYLTVRDRDLANFSSDKQTRGERIDPEGTLMENNDMFKRTKLGIKVRQHKDLNRQDGLDKVRQIIARQRHGKESGEADKREAGQSNWKSTAYPTSIPPTETASLHPTSSVAGGSDKTSDAGLSDEGRGIASRLLHRNDDPIRPSRRTRREPRTVSIPRKVAQAPAPPSYRGFSEIISHKTSAASDSDRRLMTDATRKRGPDEPLVGPVGSRPEEALTGVNRVEVQTSNQTVGSAVPDAKSKKLVQFDKEAGKTSGSELSKKQVSPLKGGHVEPASHKKLTKPNKSDINVRSWRAGIQVVKQELGKLPKMSLSPPTKDGSPEQHHDDIGMTLPSNPPARSKSDDLHNRITEKLNDNDIDRTQMMNKFKEKRGGATVVVDDRERSDVDEDRNEDKEEDIRDQSAQARDEIHDHRERETDDAQNEKDEDDDDDRSISHEHHAVVKLPTKSKPLSLARKIHKPPEPEKEKDRKASRDISYDKVQVKEYMAKQKAERKRKEKEEQMEKQRAEENRQRQLDELSKKQKQSARLRSCPARTNKGKQRMGSREGDSTDSGGHHHGDVSLAELSSAEERSCEGVQNSKKNSEKTNRTRFDQDTSESGTERKTDFNHRELRGKASELTQKSATQHGSDTRMMGSEAKSSFPKEMKNSFPSNSDSKKNSNPDGASSAINDAVGWRQPSADATSSAVDSVHSQPATDLSRNIEARWATLAQSAQSLQSRLNDHTNSVATAFNSRVSSSKPTIPAPNRSQSSAFPQPVRNVWVPTDLAAVQTAPAFLSNGYADDLDEESDSTLTEESAAQLEKPSSLHTLKFTGTNAAAQPFLYRGKIVAKDQERKNSDIDRWITKRERKDSDMESTITGSMMSDTESDGKADSTAAVLPGRQNELRVDTVRDSDHMLKLKTMQQTHRATMLSLQAKSQQDLILASWRPLTQKAEMDSLRFAGTTFDSQSSVSDQRPFFPGPGTQSASVLHLQSNYLPGSQFSVESFSGKQVALESTKELEPSSIHYRSLSKGSRSALPSHQPQAMTSLASSAKRDRSQSEKGLDGSFDLDSSVTEEEMERSLREVVPSERQRKRLRRDASLTAVADQSSAKHVFESESFDTFSLNLVRDYLTQEQSRIQHQHSLLKLREQALADKTRAELAWLEQQKQKTRKGGDDSYPAIRQKQKEVLEKHKKEETGLRILQDFTKQAMKMQQGSMTEIEKITLMQQTAQQIKQELNRQNPRVRRWLDAGELTLSMLSSDSESAASVASGGKQLSERLKKAGVGFKDFAIPLSDTRNDDQKSLECMTTDTSRSQSPLRESGVGLEMTVDTSVIDLNFAQSSSSPMQEKIAHKLKMQLDKKYLTAREQKLRQRRMEAEKLLAWKNRLDREEEEVVQLEMEAAGKMTLKMDAPEGDGHDVIPAATLGSASGSVDYKDCCTSPFYPSPIPSTEHLRQGHLEQGLPKVTPPLRQEDLDTSKPMEKIITGSKEVVAQTESDVASLSVAATDSVDAASVPNARQLSPEELRTSDLSELSNHRRRNSASETEESVSIPISELTSDQSDIERQVRALKEELLRKKIEVENLRKRKKREKLKAKEDSLKKKIELVNEEIEKLATMSPIDLKELGSPEPSVTSPLTDLEPSVHSVKEVLKGRDVPSVSQATVCVEVPEKHLHDKDTQHGTSILISIPKNDHEIKPKGLHFSESSIEANAPGLHKPLNSVNLPDAKSSAIASEVNKGEMAGPSGNSPALDVTDLDDFFDVTVNSMSSRALFKVSEDNHTKAGIEKDKQDEINKSGSEDLNASLTDREDEGERSEKSAVSVASRDSLDSVSNRSRSSVSAKSDVKKGTIKPKEDVLNNENSEDVSMASDRSAKSVSSVESKNSKPSLSEKSHSALSAKSDDKIRRRASKETTDLPSDKNAEGESLASEKSTRSISSKASNESRSNKSRSAISEKFDDDNIKEKALVERAVSRDDEDSERSASSARSSRRSLSKSSDNSKISHGSKKTAPSTSSHIRSYAEDFSTGSKQLSNKNASEEHGSVEEEHTVCRSDAEEVKTEDDISSSLSEDGELENDDQTSKFHLDLTKNPAATSESSPRHVSSVKGKDPSKNASRSIKDPSDMSKSASILAEDAKDVSKTSLSSDDNLMKEHLPELPSETDMQNESADQTSPSIGDGRMDAEERSLSGAGDSELERVISSAAAAVELFDDQSPNASSSVVPDAVAGRVDAREAGSDIADETVTGLVSEAISEVLAIKAKKEASSSADNDNNSSGWSGTQHKPEQRTSSSFALFDDWGDEGEFLDDDLDWSPARNTPPPPPYTEGPKDDLGSQKQPTSLHLPGLTVHPPEPPIVVPHTADEIQTLADQVVDIFWQLRRCGESWDDVQPTEDYLGVDANGVTLESSSCRMYKQLIFEVVAEFLRDMYRDEEDVSDLYPLVPPRPTKWKQFYKEQEPPKTLDVLKPVVRLHVKHTVGQQVALQKVPRKWSTRRKDDGVDRVLVKELHDEEPEWVSYESDTVNIKMQLSDAIFQLLLVDTASTLRNVQQRIAAHQLQEF